MSEQYIVRAGADWEPYHYGPFDSAQEAEEWIEKEQRDEGVLDNLSASVFVLNLP